MDGSCDTGTAFRPARLIFTRTKCYHTVYHSVRRPCIQVAYAERLFATKGLRCHAWACTVNLLSFLTACMLHADNSND